MVGGGRRFVGKPHFMRFILRRIEATLPIQPKTSEILLKNWKLPYPSYPTTQHFRRLSPGESASVVSSFRRVHADAIFDCALMPRNRSGSCEGREFLGCKKKYMH